MESIITQQQQQPQRSVGELLILGIGGTAITLGALWALKQLFPGQMPS